MNFSTVQRLDHIAIRATDRAASAEELLSQLDIKQLDMDERLTLLGPTIEAGKITLLDADKGDELQQRRIVSIVLSDGESGITSPPITTSTGLVFTFGRADATNVVAPRHSVIGVTLRTLDPPMVAAELARSFGFMAGSMQRDVATVYIGHDGGGGWLTFVRERDDKSGDAQVLDHIGIMVDDLDVTRTSLVEAGVEIDREVQADISNALFVTAPEGFTIEYIEQIDKTLSDS